MAKISAKFIDWNNGWMYGVSPAMERRVVGEEAIIGEWVEDGVTYDLYRKIVVFGSLPNAGSKAVRHEVTNKLKFVRIYGIATGTNGNNLTIPFAANDSPKNIYIGVGNNLITITTGEDRSSFDAYITLEFTRART